MNDPLQKKPEIILFDLDGTLLDNSMKVADAYYHALKEYNYPEKSREFIATLAGKSARDTAAAMDVQEKDWTHIENYFWNYFDQFSRDPEEHSVVFEGARELLELCSHKNIRMAIVTSNRKTIAQNMLQKEDMLHYFETVIGEDDVTEKKPSSEPVNKALDTMGYPNNNELDPEKIWLVGDSASDVGAARNSGALGIAIARPHTFEEVLLHGPDVIVDSLDALMAILKDL